MHFLGVYFICNYVGRGMKKGALSVSDVFSTQHLTQRKSSVIESYLYYMIS